jgi:ABC-2 type transport system ATP-binding protein
VTRRGDAVTVCGEGPLLARVAHALVEHGHEPADLRAELATLEDAYLALTHPTTAPANDPQGGGVR